VGLAGGATTTLTSNVLISDATGAIVAGTYRLRVIADPSNARPEADETNNTFLTGVLRVVPSDSL
jgi:subtilase family serine protease